MVQRHLLNSQWPKKLNPYQVQNNIRFNSTIYSRSQKYSGILLAYVDQRRRNTYAPLCSALAGDGGNF